MSVAVNLSKKAWVVLLYTSVLFYLPSYFMPLQDSNGSLVPDVPMFVKVSGDAVLLLIYFLLIFISFSRPVFAYRKVYLLFVFYALLATLWLSFYLSASELLVHHFRNLVFFGLAIIPLAQVEFKPGNIFAHLKWLAWIVVFVGLLTCTFKFTGVKPIVTGGYWLYSGDRVSSTFTDPDSLGFFCFLVACLLWFKPKKKPFELLLLALLFIVIALSKSLTCFLGFFFVFLVEVYRKVRFGASFKSWLSFIVVATLAGLAVLYMLNEILHQLDLLQHKSTYLRRLIEAREVIDRFEDSSVWALLFGGGASKLLIGGGGANFVRMDSMYYTIFFNYGFLGTVLYILFALMCLHQVLKRSMNDSMKFALLSFTLWLFFLGNFSTPYLYRWYLLVQFFFVMHVFTGNRLRKVKYL